MSYPPQQPGGWPEQSWPAQNQPYSDPGYGAYPGYPASAPGYGYGYGPPVMVQPTNGLAVGAMVVSLTGILTCGFTGLIGAILGHVARKQIRERGEGGDGMALAGVIVGWIMFALFCLGLLFYVGFFALILGTAATSGYDPSTYPS